MKAESIIDQLGTLSLAELRKVATATTALISQIESWQQPTPKTPEKTKTYRQEYIRCGKPTCRCVAGEGHGPYWFAYWSQGGRTRKEYIGKKLPPVAEGEQGPAEAVAR
jgi:hypothetical protein